MISDTVGRDLKSCRDIYLMMPKSVRSSITRKCGASGYNEQEHDVKIERREIALPNTGLCKSRQARCGYSPDEEQKCPVTDTFGNARTRPYPRW